MHVLAARIALFDGRERATKVKLVYPTASASPAVATTSHPQRCKKLATGCCLCIGCRMYENKHGTRMFVDAVSCQLARVAKNDAIQS
jgi:hypothetical protein